MDKVVGVDAHKRGWVGIGLEDGRYSSATHFRDFSEVVSSCTDASIIAVDIPIGLPDSGHRSADQLARVFVSTRRASVFLIPPRAAMEQSTYMKALEVSRGLTGRGMAKQAYSLREKIFEVERYATEDPRVIEIHPEVSFRGMAGRPLSYGKRTWGGVVERKRLLDEAGILLPEDLGKAVNIISADDVIDAAVAAWSARRYHMGEAQRLPDFASVRDGDAGAIWF